MERSEQKQERIALFPGSFDPFTIGHQSLVKRGLALADRIIIAIGINENKQSCFPLEERLEAIRSLFQDDPRIEVTGEEIMNAMANRIKNDDKLRIDFEYEKTIADINRTLTGIETVFLLAEPQYAHISSSAVRELLHFGKDVSAFLP